MQLKDILVCVASAEDDGGALALASVIATSADAHLSCAAIGVLPTPVAPYGELGPGVIFTELMEQGGKAVAAFWRATEALVAREDRAIEMRRVQVFASQVESTTAMHARHADLVVVGAPVVGLEQPHADMIEGALLGGGRPVLVAPRGWRGGPLGERVFVAWDASREAARAVHDALCLIRPGADVCIVTIDAEPRPMGHGENPGIDIATHLARHNLRVDLRREDSLGRPLAQTLRETAVSFNPDLIVMGGYRHPRLQQALFGGATRAALRDPIAPLFLSH